MNKLTFMLFMVFTNCATATTPGLPFDVPPKIVGGYEAIMDCVVYPLGAFNRGLEAKIVLQVKIDTTGHVSEFVIVQGDSVFDDYAINAIRNTKFIPAYKDATPVEVWMNIPVKFEIQAVRNNKIKVERR